MNFQTISIGEVLADSQIGTTPNGEARSFSLKFAKDDGSVSSLAKASRNVKLGKATKGSHTNLRQQNLMLVYDHESKTHKHITIALITHYNGVRVFH
jgi:hypothetical protein